MKKLLLLVGLAALAPLGASTSASAQRPSLHTLARAECLEERRDDRAEFRREHGGTGVAALRICIRKEKREAERECREEWREDRAKFRRDYGGTGARAFGRCHRDELE
jgi:hypothetical protein